MQASELVHLSGPLFESLSLTRSPSRFYLSLFLSVSLFISFLSALSLALCLALYRFPICLASAKELYTPIQGEMLVLFISSLVGT